MNKRRLCGMICLLLLVMGAAGAPSAANKPEPAPLTPGGEKLMAEYGEMLKELQSEIAKSLPSIEEKKREAFLKAYAAEAGVMSAENLTEALVKGKNTLSFTRETVHNGLAIKQFTLTLETAQHGPRLANAVGPP